MQSFYIVLEIIVTLNILFQKYVKYVKNLIGVTTYGDYCSLATKAEEGVGQVRVIYLRLFWILEQQV